MGIWGVVGMGGHNVDSRSGIASRGCYDFDPGGDHPIQKSGEAFDFCIGIAPYIQYNSWLNDQIYVNYKSLKRKLRGYKTMDGGEISKIVNDFVSLKRD